MPHDDVIMVQAEFDQLLAETKRLDVENAQLRNFLIKLMRTIKEIELTLQKALDEDSH